MQGAIGNGGSNERVKLTPSGAHVTGEQREQGHLHHTTYNVADSPHGAM